jgi:hypothetical protein
MGSMARQPGRLSKSRARRNEEVEVTATSGVDVKVVRQTMRERRAGRAAPRSIRLLEKVARRMRRRA